MSAANYPKPASYNPFMSAVLTIEQGKELVRLCRTGRLYEVDTWIASGKSLSVPSEIKKTPLQIAVDIGFHSLIRLLACHEKDVANLNEELSDAVALRNLDAVNLLLEHGANLRSVPLADVLLSWDPKLIHLFLDGEAEALRGAAVYCSFLRKSQNGSSPLHKLQAGAF